MTVLDIDTPQGRAKAHLHPADGPVGALVLGHGAAGGVAARDLVAVTEAARSEGFSVALVEQPYRVAGRRSSPPAERLDAAWTAVVEHLRGGELGGLPLVVGGRSAGARVACRTAAESGAVAVLCLAFPLHPPRRSPGGAVKTRQPELDAVQVPSLVVQGAGDPFGTPPPGPTRSVITVPGTHSLTTDIDAVAAHVRAWLPRVVSQARVVS
jgi:predicted alpha/beta-hydrolase family hydrolase